MLTIQLIASLNSVAEQMRHCANVADQFAQMLTQTPIGASLTVYAGSKRLGTEEEDIEGAVKKRRIASRKARDPDAPKRAASSYIFFQNDLRQELRKQHPDITSSEIMSRVKKQWAEMTPEQKAVRIFPLNSSCTSLLTLPFSPMSTFKLRLNRSGRQRSELMTSAGGLWLLRSRLVVRRQRQLLKSLCNPLQWLYPLVPFLCGRTWDTKVFQATKISQKTPESSDSSTDTNSSDKSSGEEGGTGGNSDEEDDEEKEEELPAPSPPPSKTKAKRKAEIATATTTKPRGQVGSSAGPIPARPEKKKRSKV